jgi:signal peptidase I
MMPTLEMGDFVLVNRLTYRIEDPERGDVVVFAYPRDPSKLFVKRIIGIAGDLVEARDKEMYLNGESLTEDYVVHTDPRVFPAELSSRDVFGPVSVPPNSVFVLGDNRDNSHDSRFYGAIATHHIKGKVFSIYASWDAEGHKPRWERCGSIDR